MPRFQGDKDLERAFEQARRDCRDRLCMAPDCRKPLSRLMPHGWTCEEHDPGRRRPKREVK